MKQGQKPAEPRMEDVLASIRRAIDENAAGMPAERFGGSMAELRVKLDPSPAVPESRPRRDFDYASTSQQPQGFAGILGGKRGDRKSTRLNSSHIQKSRMPSSA